MKCGSVWQLVIFQFIGNVPENDDQPSNLAVPHFSVWSHIYWVNLSLIDWWFSVSQTVHWGVSYAAKNIFFCAVSKASNVYYIYIHTYIHTIIYTHIHTILYTCIIWLYMYIYICVYIYSVCPLFVKDGVLCCGSLLSLLLTFYIVWPRRHAAIYHPMWSH